MAGRDYGSYSSDMFNDALMQNMLNQGRIEQPNLQRRRTGSSWFNEDAFIDVRLRDSLMFDGTTRDYNRNFNRSHLERMLYRNNRDSRYYQQLWEGIAADWRRSSVRGGINTFGTTVYLPLRRAVRGFLRRWRARNQWRMNIPGIPVAGITWDANNPRLGRRAQGGESGLIG